MLTGKESNPQNWHSDLMQYIILHTQNFPINFRIHLSAKCISKLP